MEGAEAGEASCSLGVGISGSAMTAIPGLSSKLGSLSADVGSGSYGRLSQMFSLDLETRLDEAAKLSLELGSPQIRGSLRSSKSCVSSRLREDRDKLCVDFLALVAR